MMYASKTNPASNIDKGIGVWAKVEGRSKFANGFANFLIDNSPYADLISNLEETSSPDIDG